MGIDSLGLKRTIVSGICPVKVKLNRACFCGDLLGVAEDNFDDLGPEDAAISGHDTNKTYLPRLVAGEAGEADKWIIAYPVAVVRGYSGATLGAPLYPADAATALGTVDETAAATAAATGTDAACFCVSIVGMVLSATDVLLFPGMYSHEDEVT